MAFLCLRRGVSSILGFIYNWRYFSLPTQRCFPFVEDLGRAARLFSAYAEVFPDCSLRSTGGFFFSLPTQRCFQRVGQDAFEVLLFSAYAEVFPRRRVTLCIYFPFLCLRRGVSLSPGCGYVQKVFSLPTQRCFCVIHSGSASPPTFLCLRRGVSVPRLYLHHPASFSLPTQRCFRHHAIRSLIGELFSAYAEVFPATSHSAAPMTAFLCLRRGVSMATRLALPPLALFSAYAEVFPRSSRWPTSSGTFLCLRRGVSRSSTPNAMIRSFSLPTQRCFFLSISEGWERSLFSAYAEVFL